MHGLTPKPKPLRLWLAAGLVLLSSFSASAQPPARPIRQLFVVETSLAMAEHKPAVAQFLGACIATGAAGQLHNGDTFCVWTFDQTVSTNRYLPAQWTSRGREKIGGRFARALQDQPFYGVGEFASARAEVGKVIASADRLTVRIIHREKALMLGTSFDEKIRAASEASSTQVFVTTLLAQSGRVIAWSVDQLVAGPPSAPVTVPEPAFASTIPVSSAKAPVESLAPGRDLIASRSGENRAVNNPSPAPSPAVEPVYSAAPPPRPVAQAGPIPAFPAEWSTVAVHEPSATSSHSVQSEPVRPPAVPPEPVAVQTVQTPGRARPDQGQPAAVPAKAGAIPTAETAIRASNSATFLIIGLVFLFLGAATLVTLTRSKRPVASASLISRSLEQSRG